MFDDLIEMLRMMRAAIDDTLAILDDASAARRVLVRATADDELDLQAEGERLITEHGGFGASRN
jgi:hypothetical protein